jgi:hypothetical protein
MPLVCRHPANPGRDLDSAAVNSRSPAGL